jgi:hypothetical protein
MRGFVLIYFNSPFLGPIVYVIDGGLEFHSEGNVDLSFYAALLGGLICSEVGTSDCRYNVLRTVQRGKC